MVNNVLLVNNSTDTSMVFVKIESYTNSGYTNVHSFCKNGA